jgi:hypothetical protein
MATWLMDGELFATLESHGRMMPPHRSVHTSLQHELSEGVLTPEQGSCQRSEFVVCDHDSADANQGGRERPPLYSSGIAWIDRAYNVIRQLRRDHGLPDIRPLTEPPFRSDSAAIVTSSDGQGPARRQPPEHRKASSIQPE